MPRLPPEDGNLIILNDSQLEGLLQNCDKSFEGGFGTVYICKSFQNKILIFRKEINITLYSNDKLLFYFSLF